MYTQAVINSIIIALLTAGLSYSMAAFWYHKNKKDIETRTRAEALAEAEKMSNARIADLEMKLVALTTAVTPISAAMQAVLIKELTHFHTPELDELLVQVEAGSLSEEDEWRLERLLKERTTDIDVDISQSEREAAIMLPMIRRRVKNERTQAAVDIQVVSMTASQEASLSCREIWE